MLRSLRGIIVLSLMTGPVWADNGLSPVAWDARAVATAGACLACDHGVAAAMDNPAAVSLMREGRRGDFLATFNDPGVTAADGGPMTASRRDSLWFPSMGWAGRKGRLTYGAGAFRQGGVATDYGGSDSGRPQRSEIEAGRLVVPVAWQLTEHWTIGGSLGYAWVGMDLQTTVPDAANMLLGGGRSAVISGSMISTMQTMSGLGSLQGGGSGAVNSAWLGFRDPGQFAGGASGTGHGGIFGAVYRIGAGTRIGFAYRDRTAYSTLHGEEAQLILDLNLDDNYIAGTWDGVTPGGGAGTYSSQQLVLDGHVRVRRFFWPALYGIGITHDADSGLEVHAALRYIPWSEAMDALRLEFVADSSQAAVAAPLTATELKLKLNQHWRDQTIISLGGGVPLWSGGKLRVGYSYANAPVPDAWINPLFPALTREHYSFGLEQRFGAVVSADMSFFAGREEERSNTYSNPGARVRQAPRGAMFTVAVYY